MRNKMSWAENNTNGTLTNMPRFKEEKPNLANFYDLCMYDTGHTGGCLFISDYKAIYHFVETHIAINLPFVNGKSMV